VSVTVIADNPLSVHTLVSISPWSVPLGPGRNTQDVQYVGVSDHKSLLVPISMTEFFSSNKDTWKSKRIHIAFSSYFTCITQSLSLSSASAHSYTSFRWLVLNGFPFFRLSYQLSEVGWSLSGFFLLIWLSRTTISLPSTISLYPRASA